MNISAPFGSGCVGDDAKPFLIRVTDCVDPDSITWTTTVKPANAPDLVFTSLGDGEYEISSPVAGAFAFEGECCA